MGAEIIVLEQKTREKLLTLNDFLYRAKQLKKETKEKQKEDCLMIKSLDDLEKIFEVKLNDFLLDHRLISAEYFICAMFIASLLKETSFSIPESWYAVDYFIENQEIGDPELLLDGANNCFLLSTLFTKRCEKRGMKRSDYVFMGAGLYQNFYHQTGKEVACYMGSLFETMSEATAKCIKSL